MDDLRLRFTDGTRPELTLGAGVHAIGHADGRAGALAPVADVAGSVAQFCVDRRGVWLRVSDGARGVHVNGRAVRRMAMLRVGDAVYVDGVEMRLVQAQPPEAPGIELDGVTADADAARDVRVVLRGVGGQYHGRSVTLGQPRLIGRHADADIRIDEPAFADRHARIELLGDQVVLRDLGSAEGSVVNGVTVRHALLHSGDQVVFDAHHRFVVEAPARAGRRSAPEAADAAQALAQAEADVPRPPRSPAWRLPWLLVAALALAALLSALLLFGSP